MPATVKISQPAEASTYGRLVERGSVCKEICAACVLLCKQLSCMRVMSADQRNLPNWTIAEKTLTERRLLAHQLGPRGINDEHLLCYTALDSISEKKQNACATTQEKCLQCDLGGSRQLLYVLP